MRLVCPKCAAQYEVDASAIPETGRDVQCASCGDTWFQEPFSDTETAAGVADQAEREPDEDQPLVDPDNDQETPHGQHTKTDTAVLDILRHEAELDAAARSGMPIPDKREPHDDPAAGFDLANTRNRKRRLHLLTPDEETASDQSTDVNADNIPEPPEVVPTPVSTHSPKAEPAELTTAPKRNTQTKAEAGPPRNRRDLPDVESLNSSLRSADDTSRGHTRNKPAVTNTKPTNRRGRTGFSFAILLAVILFATYALAPRIEAAFPATQPYLDQFVSSINHMRLRFADSVTSLVALLKGFAIG